MSDTDSIGNSLTSAVIQKTKTRPYQCKICRAPTDYAYFGVISCECCRKFFKRNAERGQNVFKCDDNEQCDINGMTTDKFRPSRSTKPKTNSLVKVQSQANQLEQLPTLNLLQSDSSLLTTDDWTHLSNLCHIYQESRLVSVSQRLIDTHRLLPFMNNNYDILAKEYLTCLYETTGTYLRLNANFSKLASNDRSVVLRNAADHITCLGSAFIVHHYDLLFLRNFYNHMAMKYGKCTVDLQRWTTKYIDPDIILVKLTFSLFAFSQTTCLYNPNNTIYLTDSIFIYHIQSKYADITWKYLIYKYGYYEAIKRFTRMISWLLTTTVFISHCQSLAQHVNDVESLVEQTELSLILDDVEDIVS